MKDQKHMVWSLWCKCEYITLILAQEKQRRHQDVAISLIIYPCIFGNNINQMKGSIILRWSTTTTSTPQPPLSTLSTPLQRLAACKHQQSIIWKFAFSLSISPSDTASGTKRCTTNEKLLITFLGAWSSKGSCLRQNSLIIDPTDMKVLIRSHCLIRNCVLMCLSVSQIISLTKAYWYCVGVIVFLESFHQWHPCNDHRTFLIIFKVNLLNLHSAENICD